MFKESKAIWLFGLSGAGKTTLAKELIKEYAGRQVKTILLDGDVIRKGICKDLGFGKHDRFENVRRIAKICNLMLGAGVIPIVAAITPMSATEDLSRT